MDRIYLTSSEVRALHADNLEKLTFVHLNAQSARNKEDNILALIAEFGFEPDVFMMTETWYRNDSDVLRPGFRNAPNLRPFPYLTQGALHAT